MIPSSTNTSLIDILESLLKYLIITGKLPFKAFAKTSVEEAARRAFFKKFMIYKLNLASWQFMFLESIVKNLKEREIIITRSNIFTQNNICTSNTVLNSAYCVDLKNVLG